jgi:hypothetical protein
MLAVVRLSVFLSARNSSAHTERIFMKFGIFYILKACRENSSLTKPLMTELNPSAQSWMPRFLLGILIFKGLTARRLYKSFSIKGLKSDRNKGHLS